MTRDEKKNKKHAQPGGCAKIVYSPRDTIIRRRTRCLLSTLFLYMVGFQVEEEEKEEKEGFWILVVSSVCQIKIRTRCPEANPPAAILPCR